ncbi:MAG: hypothetical protein IPH26_19440 [Sterolibacteriaceae bacterium]|uniref:Uncharacterized protein n=1 Tax=Candidatus Methylophosphatis roskildensis TaxID=2899263 RepID=A0A9D7HVX8_9PROT|nr:hypothetical protein [Candidatus Methylophosphatis roskildensis]MBK7237314.1 hypothetical protein [Sterolibacteriaceae bacterium]
MVIGGFSDPVTGINKGTAIDRARRRRLRQPRNARLAFTDGAKPFVEWYAEVLSAPADTGIDIWARRR